MTPRLEPMPKISISGSRGLFVDAAGEFFLDQIQLRIISLSKAVAQLNQVCEVVLGMNNLLIVYRPDSISPSVLAEQVADIWRNVKVDMEPGREIEVPVIYGGSLGEDLAAIASLAGLTIDEFIHTHSGAHYQVACIGAMPGFPYLSGLDPRLTTARREVPRMKVIQGSVIIGGAQTGIMPCSGPSGWHVIGRTELQLFDWSREQPSFLRPGDRVRFVVAGIES